MSESSAENFSTQNGSCLCGSVTFTAKQFSHKVGACHCRTCRKWGGGPFMEVDCGAQVEFGGTEHIKCYQSSDWAERGFCLNCGSHLFYRLKHNQQHMVPVGLFDEEVNLSFTHQVFIDEKPGYYAFENKTKEMTGKEIFAMFAPKE